MMKAALLLPAQFRRCLHAMPAYAFREGAGIDPFLSGRATELLHSLHRHYLHRLNHALAASPLATLPLYQLLERTYQDSAQALVHHYASQAWNMDFWLQGLAPAAMHRPPLPALHQALERDFGSFTAFQELFSSSAAAMVASGWTWLVKRPNGKLAVLNTYNGGSPVYVNFRSPLSRRPMVDTSVSAMLGLKRTVASEEETMIAKEQGQIVPLLGLNMWEHAWIGDYGLHREEYIANFWKCVNWNRVAVILNIY